MSRIQKRATTSKLNIIEQVAREAKNRGITDVKTKESIQWYRNFISKNVYGVRIFEHLDQKRIKTRPSVGKMYIYGYDAKHKDDLSYWDAMPVTIFFSETDTLVTGFNLHYAPIEMRVLILSKLYSIMIDETITEKSRLTQSYTFLKGLSTFDIMKPLIHSYLKTNFTTQLIEVPATQWPIAVFLPLAKWQKAHFNTVYADYRKNIRKGK